MEEKQISLIQQQIDNRQIQICSRLDGDNFFQQSSKTEQGSDGMENFILQKYSQISNLQNYLVKELNLIQQFKIKQSSINNLIKKKILPSIQQFKDTLKVLQSFIESSSSLAVSYVSAVSQKCKQMLEQKEQRYLDSQREIRQLKCQNHSLKEKIICLQTIQSLKEQEQLTKKQRIFSYKNIELPTNKRYIDQTVGQPDCTKLTLPQKLTQLIKNDPYLLDLSPNTCKQKNPLNDLEENKTFKKTNQGSLFNKRINISYRCQRSTNDKLTTSKSHSNFTPSKSVEKMKTTKTIQGNFTMFPSANRKEFIKQKIQNMKLKSENQYKNYPNRLK